MLIPLILTIALGLFAASTFCECIEAKRIRKDRLRVQRIVKEKYPGVY